MKSEITRLLSDEFLPDNEDLANIYRAAVKDSSCLTALSYNIQERVMKRAMGECAMINLRADGRGTNAVRPISATTPIFPDCVHGSSQFSRGETQVICTASIGAPSDGVPHASPYSDSSFDVTESSRDAETNDNLVGSLRFLRSQVEMECKCRVSFSTVLCSHSILCQFIQLFLPFSADMNSRKVKAGREMTGDSGVLREVSIVLK